MNRQEYLLVCLMEEAAEVQQAASKALRFGMENRHPAEGVTNGEALATELVDLLAVRYMLMNECLIPADAIAEDIMLNKKCVKVDNYISAAQKRNI